MLDYLKRLVTTGAAYQFGDILAKAIALVTIPLYTRYVPRAGYGAASSLLTAVILSSIFLRAGLGVFFGVLIPATNAMVGLATPGSLRGSAYGLTSSATALGNAIGPLLGDLQFASSEELQKGGVKPLTQQWTI